ncbi:MAG: hypothetical protein CMF36_02115 [Leeuwenhoekiella sp.]|nr:hypothetical protein [Leeuwenhoekiella sp.]MBA79910.1 hypothetical protein [Leeuwenhoekiella sp.]
MICLAFEKAKIQEEKRGYVKPSKSRLAARLSTEVENMAGFAFGEKSLLNYYNTAVSSKHQELRIPQIEVIDALVQYSGFSSYSAFIAEQEPINETRYMLPRKGRLVFKLGRLKIESIWFFKLSI